MQNNEAQIYREFWLKVIRNAQEEAEGHHIIDGSRHPNRARIQRRAVRWLTSCSKSLWEVCEMAGMNKVQFQTLVEHNQEIYGGKDGQRV